MKLQFLPGVEIGNNVIIGACSFVAKSIPDYSVYAGNPARFMKTTEDYFKKIGAESLHVGKLSPSKED